MPLEPLPKELQAAAIANALESSAPMSRPSISILGYGVTTKPIVAFLNALGKACAIYDDKPEGKRLDSSSGGDVENILLDSREFCPESSALEILSPGIPPDHKYFGGAKRAISEYDFIWLLCGDLASLVDSALRDKSLIASRALRLHTSSMRPCTRSQSKDFSSQILESCAQIDKQTSTTPRILEEENQASPSLRAVSAKQSTLESSAKVDSRETAQNVENSAKDSRSLENKNSNVFFQNAEILNTPQTQLNLDSSKSPCDSKILDEKCGLQGKSQGSYLDGNDRRDFSPLPHFSLKAESPQAQKPTPPTQIWISGTNGKTTTTQMLTHILAPFGALSGGNIGTPLITLYEKQAKLWVLETSSFALHYTKAATPRIYALLPLSQDHISWHNGFAGYVDDKLSALARMGADSVAIVPSALKDHRLCKEFAGEMVLYRDSSDLRAFLHAKGLELGENDLPFFEPFLLDASIALASAVALMSLSPSVPAQAAASFVPALARFTIGAHRMEEFYVRAFGAEWLFVDDSKGTNTDATLQAITRYKDCALFLILGGDDKGADCTEIFTLLQHIHNAQIFTIGSNEPKLLDLAARHNVKAHKCGTLDCAMEKIWAIIAGFMDSRSEAQSLESTFENATNAPTLSTIQPPQAQETCPSTAAKRKRFIPLPSPLTQKDKATAFSFCNQGGSLAFPLLALARRRDTTARLTPTLAHHEAGENQCEPSLAFKEIDSASAEFVCLLSPAAASLDQFSSYKERGELFKTLAKSLANHT